MCNIYKFSAGFRPYIVYGGIKYTYKGSVGYFGDISWQDYYNKDIEDGIYQIAASGSWLDIIINGKPMYDLYYRIEWEKTSITQDSNLDISWEIIDPQNLR